MIKRQLTQSGKTHVFSEPKTREGARILPLDRGTIAALQAHRAAQGAERLLLGSGS